MITHRIRWLLSVLTVAAGLSACQTSGPGTLPDLTFAHLDPIGLAVGEVRVLQKHSPATADPFVDHLFAIPPAIAANRWGRDRLKAQGGAGRAIFTILEGPVREHRLKATLGVRGVFTKDQTERYEARLSAKLEIFDGHGLSVGNATATVTRIRTIAEDVTLNERERLWFDMTEVMMRDFNAEMEKQIRTHLGSWLR